ncbi:hypothetical protein GA0061098_101328 [Bradyrhizobium shewense]|uniref:Uncharacterized protein n=1 Tax=Bradyrhizobium shewense TaxID=1761772 RepID=A0A1C3X8R8_9BRAD|nr:hypothetical protein [Bradyrhizobium shewense]SCB48384.1 hypothetical protein GA0061098_101328 [Bradyrhizobium shewense]
MTATLKSRTLGEARDIINRKVEALRGELTNVDFVLCEDFKTVMVYADVDSEPDAVSVYFDLAQAEAFDPERHAADFFSSPASRRATV